MRQIRKRLTYANVMSSIAVFLVVGGATAFAALGKNTVGTRQLKPKAVRVGKIGPEAVRAGKIAEDAIATNRLRDNAVTGAKVKESTLGTVPSATNAENLGGQSPSAYLARNDLLWALVNSAGGLVDGSGATAATRISAGNFRVTFDRAISQCITEGTATDVSGGAAPDGKYARIVGTDNRVQANTSTVDVTTTNPAGTSEDPETGDGFTVTVYC